MPEEKKASDPPEPTVIVDKPQPEEIKLEDPVPHIPQVEVEQNENLEGIADIS